MDYKPKLLKEALAEKDIKVDVKVIHDYIIKNVVNSNKTKTAEQLLI